MSEYSVSGPEQMQSPDTDGLIRTALETVVEEQEDVVEEIQQFDEFASEVRQLSAPTSSVSGTTVQQVNTSTVTGTGSRMLEQIRNQYRQTVMSTPDFECEYGESFHEHIATEFGNDTAKLLTEGHQFSEPVKQLVIQQAGQSKEQRELLLEGLTIEEQSLREIDAELEPIRHRLSSIDSIDLARESLDSLAALDSELKTHIQHCNRLLETRQDEIHTVNRRMHGESKTVTQEYLYGNFSVRFPVLTAILDCSDRLAECRKAVGRAVSEKR